MRFHVVDAFTDRPFAGNPAGVVVLPAGEWPADARLQAAAAELAHPETAFVLPGASDAEGEIRWFTPTVEASLCGHATLAAAHVLHTEHGRTGTLALSSRRHGTLFARIDADGAITLDFPAAPHHPAPVPEGLVAALGGAAVPEAVFTTGALGDLLVVLADEAAVHAVRPDFLAIAALTAREGLRGLAVTAPAADPAGSGYAFASRFFAPAHGIPEDPVTGSAHTAFAPYWAARLGRDGLVGAQGSARRGRVRTEVVGDRVLLAGGALTTVTGELHVF
ncbi:PhzF family phenazine biosynthesis protein [Streptomyces sp. BI20]|uniref:PhzF family phenazine biosynthesis protein n=1 Tax=Streptomyces sp. BI20 TaxID=3403460 RepID=UPI003C7302F2